MVEVETMNRRFLSRDENLRLQAKANRRKKVRRHSPSASSRYFSDQNRLSFFFSTELRVLSSKGFVSIFYKREEILVPQIFSFRRNFDKTILFFKQLISSFVYGKDLLVNFSECENSEISAFSVLNLVKNELIELLNKYNYGRYNIVKKSIRYIPSKVDAKTNKFLHAFRYHELQQQFQDNSTYLPLYLFSGKKKSSFKENMKSTACSTIVSFVFESLLGAGHKQLPNSITIQNPLEGFVTEVLNNAEDHSPHGTEWYVNGISFREVQHEKKIVEFNLSIINFGLSMFEGFEKTKELNQGQYKTLDDLYNSHSQLFSPFNRFSKEALFTLYMLNEGISRLKYKDESRGHGTMNFIDSFIRLGKLGDVDGRFTSILNIVSGHTCLTCDNKYKPFIEGDFRKISLNMSKDVKQLPDKNYLKSYEEYFPGTILECRIYFEHIN